MLHLDLPPGVELVAFADDLAIGASALADPDLEVAITRTIEAIWTWISDQGLSLVPHKIEVITFSQRRVADPLEIVVGGYRIPLGRELNNFRVTLDGNLSFTKHVKDAVKKALVAASMVLVWAEDIICEL